MNVKTGRKSRQEFCGILAPSCIVSLMRPITSPMALPMAGNAGVSIPDPDVFEALPVQVGGALELSGFFLKRRDPEYHYLAES